MLLLDGHRMMRADDYRRAISQLSARARKAMACLIGLDSSSLVFEGFAGWDRIPGCGIVTLREIKKWSEMHGLKMRWQERTILAHHRIPAFIRTGASVRMACAVAGMSYHAMRLKAASDPAFLREIQEAKRYAQQHRGRASTRRFGIA